MAYENVRLTQRNFCLGPQPGTICSIDTSNPTTVLKIKNVAGSNIVDYSLASNIINDNVRLEYVGPLNLPEMRDGLVFFTFEKVSDSVCMIKRWETRVAYNELLLKEQIIKSNSGDEKYNAIDFAVEYYYRYFTKPNEQYTYIDVNSVVNIKSGTKLFFGPSSDTDNLGATETGIVSHIITYIGGKRVYLTSPLKYQYATGDIVTFYSHVYIYSEDGYAGDPTKGTLFKIDAYNWETKEIDTKAIYKRVNSSRWCPMVGGIASVIGSNMLFVRPYDGYLNWRSMFLSNVEDNNNTVFEVYDVVFDNYTIYKLQDRTTLRDDFGERTTYYWDEYNLQQDSILPYTQSVTTWLEQSVITGYNKNVDIYARVRDQFNVSLRDVYLSFFKSGDTGALFDPLSGNVTTDINGLATINYRSGSLYSGHTNITVRATGGSTLTGSAYVWSSNNIISYIEYGPITHKLYQLSWFFGYFYSLKQIFSTFKVFQRGVWTPPIFFMRGKSYFMTPGGDWGPSYKVQDYDLANSRHFLSSDDVRDYLPMLYTGPSHIDTPAFIGPGFGFEGLHPWDPGINSYFIGDRITLTEDASGESRLRALTDYLLYPDGNGTAVDGYVPYVVVVQPDETSVGQISQLKLSLHTHWVDGEPYDELWTGVNIDQFVFVEDAKPKFWSSKNPIDTDVWIRLRPFAFSLDNDTLRMWIREYSYLGDTGYYEITNNIDITNFDAGGGLLGVEITYNPPQDFKHDSLVFVRIEVYDTAYIPNYIYTEYWFYIIPDYKAPYLINKDPEHGEVNVPIDKTIYFEIMDAGTGINRDSLEVLLNSRRVANDYLTVEEVSRYYFKVTYQPPTDLYYGKDYKVAVKVEDTSQRKNALNTSYEFRTADSTGVLFIDPTPGPCKAGMRRFQDVSVVVLGDGNGVDKDTIRMQVFNKDISPKVVPIIYRIS